MNSSKVAAKVVVAKRSQPKQYRGLRVQATKNSGFVVTHHFKDGSLERHAFSGPNDMHAHLKDTLKRLHKGRS